MKFILLAALVCFGYEAASAKVIGKFAVAKGKVSVTDSKGKNKKARFGTSLNEGDTVVTEKNSRAKIITVDKNTINISPESKMVFEKYDIEVKEKKEAVLGLVYGKIRNEVNDKYDGKNSKFQVRTKAAVAGIRGTLWVSSYSRRSKTAGFSTVRGSIMVGTAGPGGNIQNGVPVGPGQTVGVVSGQLPGQVRRIPSAALKALMAETEVEGGPSPDDLGFFDDTGVDDGGENGTGEDGTGNGSGNDGQGKGDGTGSETGTNDQSRRRTGGNTNVAGPGSGTTGPGGGFGPGGPGGGPGFGPGAGLPGPQVPNIGDICSVCNDIVDDIVQGTTTNVLLNIKLRD